MSESFDAGVVVAMEKVAAGRVGKLLRFGKEVVRSVKDKGAKETGRILARGAGKVRQNVGRRVGSRIAGEPLIPTRTAIRMAKRRVTPGSIKSWKPGDKTLGQMAAASARAKKARPR